MNNTHPVCLPAERLGHLAAGFEPGTPFHNELSTNVLIPLRAAATRDDIQKVLTRMGTLLIPHLTDDRIADLQDVLERLKKIEGPWPVDAFQDSFLEGYGGDLPDGAHVAGRTIRDERIDRA